jgi:hypothetical protein
MEFVKLVVNVAIAMKNIYGTHCKTVIKAQQWGEGRTRDDNFLISCPFIYSSPPLY